MALGVTLLLCAVGLAPSEAANVVLLRAVPNRMAFDRTKVYAEAGKPVELVFENRDIMPHNLLIVAPGALTEVGSAAERMAVEPDASARSFVPDVPKVLHAIKLTQPGETARLSFTAPGETGEYPYACTMPGHWRQMNGTMVVVARLADVPPDRLRPPPEPGTGSRPFVHNWTFDELSPELRHVDTDRSYERGRAMFSAASCVQCHMMRGQGSTFGPDLSDLPKKLAARTMLRADVLREVLEPSRVVDPRYRPVLIETKAGAVVTGMLVGQEGGALRVQAAPEAKPREVALADIAERTESKVSLMPEGLLVTLSKEEILDLLAYLISGGDPGHPAFAKSRPR
jgi:putative heme-binding domain-containing protein